MTIKEAWDQCKDPHAMLWLYAEADNASASDLWVLATEDLNGLKIMHPSQNINAVKRKMQDIHNCVGWCVSLCTVHMMNLPVNVKEEKAKRLCEQIRYRLKLPIFEEIL